MTESISRAVLERIGFSSCSEYLPLDIVKGLKDSLLAATSKFPDLVYKSVLEVVSFLKYTF